MPTLALLCTLLAFAVCAQEPTVRGRVLDDEGQPIAGVAVCPFVAGERFVTAELAARSATTTDADGALVLTLPPADDIGAWDRVLLVAPGRLHTEATREELARFPVVLPRGRTLAGRVRDAEGRPVAGVRVEATDLLREVDYVVIGEQPRLMPQARTAARTDARGAFVLVGACESAARIAIDDVGWQPASVAPVSAMEPIALIATAAPVLRGVVVDPDGVPAAGVIVAAQTVTGAEIARTDDAGAFALTPCSRDMTVRVESTRATTNLYTRTVIPGGSAEVRLTLTALPLTTLPPLPTRARRAVAPAKPSPSLAGTLQMRAPPLAVAVRLAPHRPDVWSSTEETDYSSSFPLDREGRFKAHRLPPGEYVAQLIVLRPGRQGVPDKIPFGVVELGLDTEALRLDGRAARPAQVRGRVEAAVPVHRLAVLSAAAEGGPVFQAQLYYPGPLCPLATDGAFALQEPPGRRLLVVIDIWTGAMLWRGEIADVEPGSQREVTLRVDAIPVAFQISGEGYDSTLRYWLEIVPEAEQWPIGVGPIAAPLTGLGSRLTTNMGPALSTGQASGVLYLPRAPCVLGLRRRDERAFLRMSIDPSIEAEREVRFVVPPK